MGTQREVKTIQTPSDKEAVLKSYLTAGERNELRRIYLNNMEIGTEKEMPAITKISGSLVEEAEKKMIEIAVVSYDGNPENILGRLLDEKPEEYDFVVAEINKVLRGNFPKAK